MSLKNPNHVGSYKDSCDLIKNKKATISPINKKDSKSLQYAVTVTLNHEEIGKKKSKIPETKHFINKFNWEGITFPSKTKEWEKN